MAGIKTRHRQTNWLKELDEAAINFEPLLNWYDIYFLLARYPHLRPGYDPRTGRVVGYEREQKWFRELLLEWQDKISTRTPEVIKGLSPQQQQQLAALVLDSVGALESHALDTSNRKWAKSYLRYGRGWHHRLDRKVVAVRKALHEWESELGKLSLYPLLEVDDLEDGISIVKKKRLRLVHPDVQIVSKMLAILRERRPRCLNPESQRSYERAIVDWSKKEPVSGYMVGLFWFFHHECRCKVGDSEERTALIRNHFWKGLARAVKLNREYYYDDAKGCNAVRLAVDRNDNRSLP